MSHTLDKIDTQILAILQKDSNRTTKSIAKELGMTTSPVFERIKKLEKEGYIKKYVAVLDNKKVGLKLTVFIGITLQGHTRSYLEKFVTEINNFPEIAECHRVSGNYDYLLKLIVEDIQAYETFLISKLTLLPYLGNVQSLITLSTGKETNEIDLSRI
ncbi:Lrp/AsnC family transcriptional regulator [Winogradskyella sp.]|uniref:Lrp/AsnC family transcriptional regulator n=1 Tax=Flavobacteriaceae TaxID=49546 RepID=UPI000C65549B|nr:Lrp/AsnC family transcriptional regulator [uncultured Winogradskyella sp.]MBL85930.1 AsnC family transcriptional regulator [Winogradskyella sp.]|tara:strand:+ start:7148 stop:7621 length:474 start_codon:yes stop_codon:yes gene_type:complete